jgi:glycosyltransferase involved in cell wall biosynthesis
VSSPLISVVIPTYNRQAQLDACLAALARSTYPTDQFEVIVVDDGSQAPARLAEGLAPMDVRIFRQSNGGPAHARNQGIQAARGALIAFTDDDCDPDPNWLSQIADAHRRRPDAALGGRTVNRLPTNAYATASQLLIDFLYGWHNRGPHNGRFFASNNLALPTALLREIGGFSDSFATAAGEDRELCDRWSHHGHMLQFVPKAIVGHAHFLDLRGFWTQHHNYGRAAFHVHRARAERSQSPLRIEPAAFYIDLLRFPAGRAGPGAAVMLTGLLVVAQFANALGFFREQRQVRSGVQGHRPRVFSPSRPAE